MREGKSAAARPLGSRARLLAFAALLALYLTAVLLGAVSFPGCRNASGAVDFGHWLVPSLRQAIGEERAEYVWWLGTLPLEVFFAAIALAVVLTGRGVRLAFCLYAMYALHWLFLHATNGQVYWSDEHQLSTYIDDYHREVDRRTGARDPATEMISELYVPRARLPELLDEMRADFRRHRVELIYGSIRLIERDDESFLAWAREPWACTVLNLHVVHTPEGLAHAGAAFRRLIDMAAGHGGSYFLTYHRWATRKQVETCHPRFPELLRLKRRFDPEERFQSDWYRHYRAMFA